LSFTLMLLSIWLAPLIFGQSLHDTNNVFLSIKFLFRRVWGLPFLMLTQLVNVFFISTGRSKYIILGSLTSAALNIILDYVLIFGNWGFKPMGLLGAATASVFAEVGYCAMMYAIFYAKGLHRQYPLNIAKYFDASLAMHTLKIASPLIVQYLFSIGGWQVFFIYVEHLGQRELATSQILRSVFGVVGIITWAFASTCNTMVSNIIGQQRHNEVLPLIGKVVKLSFGLTLMVCCVLLLFPDTFISLYRSEPGLVAFARPSLQVIVLAMLIMSVSTVLFNGVVGTGNTVMNLAIEVTCVAIYLVYCYYVIEVRRMPLHWAWGSEFVYWTGLLLICLAYLRSGRWKGKMV
jgi:multidrug resistance protein, MATE family